MITRADITRTEVSRRFTELLKEQGLFEEYKSLLKKRASLAKRRRKIQAEDDKLNHRQSEIFLNLMEQINARD